MVEGEVAGEQTIGGTVPRILFSGEATSVEYEGSMHGAYLSGIRAADDIADAFGFPL